MPQAQEPDRYDPLPGFLELPGWLWRRMGRGARIALVAVLLGGLALAVALAPSIRESKESRAEREARERTEHRERLVQRLRAEQRPRFRRSASVAPPGAPDARRLAARRRLMAELRAEILADARVRIRRGELDGPVLRVECERFPRSVDGRGAEADLGRRRGNYACTAVGSEFEGNDAGPGGIIGHPYRALVDFETGRYAFCKISGQPGVSREQLVTTPKECGGR